MTGPVVTVLVAVPAGIRDHEVERSRRAGVRSYTRVGASRGGRRVVVADRVRRGAGDRGDADGLTGVGTDLEVRALERAVEQVYAVELRIGGHVVDVGGELRVLRIEVRAVVARCSWR